MWWFFQIESTIGVLPMNRSSTVFALLWVFVHAAIAKVRPAPAVCVCDPIGRRKIAAL
jgi:hypothetical protein